jgi:ABC-type microcin C transport system permease subunit YejE
MSAPASESILQRRLRKFRRLKRGYWSFLFVVGLYLLSFALPLLANNVALVVKYEGRYYVPLVTYQPASTFGQGAIGEPDYRGLKAARITTSSQKDGCTSGPCPGRYTGTTMELMMMIV